MILRKLGWFEQINARSYEETRDNVARNIDLCNDSNSHSIYVAEIYNGDIVGYVAVHWVPYLFLAGPEGYVSDLFVDEAVRGSGIGTGLLEEVKKEAVSRGCSRLMLVNSRSRDSYKRGFYHKLGWKERPEIVNFIYLLR